MNEIDIMSVVSLLFTFGNLFWMNVGMFVGILFGALPGLNGNMAITILLPFTFTLPPVSALLMLCSIYFGANFGGSISAILINTPGTNAAAATLLDGYPMAKRGFPRKGLDMALTASTFGGIVSAISLLFFAPQLGKLAMKIAAPEYFALAVLGLSVIASVSGKSILKGLITGAMGILISTVGIDGHSGLPRFTFGSMNLYSGIKMIAVLMGVYAISQMINQVISEEKETKKAELRQSEENDRLSIKEFATTIVTMIKSSIIGVFIGILPGAGSAVASFLAYNEAKRCAKPEEKFGEGELKGIAAPESANNGNTAAALIPLVTLGIPGDAVAATLMGAFTMQGLIVGPRLFEEAGPVMYAFMIGCLISQFFIFIQGKYLMSVFVKCLNIPKDLLTAILVIICATGIFALANQVFDIKVMIIAGIFGYFMKKVDLPPVPMVLGIVLGPMAEESLRNSLVVSGGSWLVFVQRPVSLVLLVVTVALVILAKWSEAKALKIVLGFEKKNNTKTAGMD